MDAVFSKAHEELDKAHVSLPWIAQPHREILASAVEFYETFSHPIDPEDIVKWFWSLIHQTEERMTKLQLKQQKKNFIDIVDEDSDGHVTEF